MYVALHHNLSRVGERRSLLLQPPSTGRPSTRSPQASYEEYDRLLALNEDVARRRLPYRGTRGCENSLPVGLDPLVAGPTFANKPQWKLKHGMPREDDCLCLPAAGLQFTILLRRTWKSRHWTPSRFVIEVGQPPLVLLTAASPPTSHMNTRLTSSPATACGVCKARSHPL